MPRVFFPSLFRPPEHTHIRTHVPMRMDGRTHMAHMNQFINQRDSFIDSFLILIRWRSCEYIDNICLFLRPCPRTYDDRQHSIDGLANWETGYWMRLLSTGRPFSLDT